MSGKFTPVLAVSSEGQKLVLVGNWYLDKIGGLDYLELYCGQKKWDDHVLMGPSQEQGNNVFVCIGLLPRNSNAEFLKLMKENLEKEGQIFDEKRG